MKQNSASRSGIFQPRVLVAFALCACGVLLGMFSVAATPPVETTRANTSVPADPANFLSTFGSNANRPPPGVPLPPSGLDAPPGRKPLRPGTASGANSLGNPVFANQQPAPLSVPQPAASESMPLASGAASDWSIVSSPNTSTMQSNILYKVTCVSASDCWGVGYYYGSVSQTLIERWDGTSWAIVASPNTSATQENVLKDVTCVSASDCWAVGYYVNFGGLSSAYQTLIEHWDGTSWAIVPSPNIGVQANQLNGVTCVSASDCWAVGYYITPSAAQTLIEHWDGILWTIVVTSPNTSSSQNNVLTAVTCVSAAADCWAVGSYNYRVGNRTVYQTLIERWDGTSWAIVTSPNTSTAQNNFLDGVTCVSAAADCWAVGYYDAGSFDYQTLIEHWDGTSWAIVPSPNTSTAQNNALYSVTCVSASDCWAVGNFYNDTAEQTLIERWDGTSWAIVSSPNTSTAQNNVLKGVTCVSAAADCWAVGYYTACDGCVIQTLIERYTPSLPPIPTNAVSRKTHGAADTFDIDLPLAGEPGIECRQGQGTNSDEHQVVLTFSAPATVASAACDGSPATTSTSGNDVTVNCTGVANGKVITIALTGVTVGAASGNVSVPMGVLLGDVTTNKSVSNTDVAEVKAQVSSPVTASNFRNDVTANGIISNTDVSTTKAQVSTSLP